MIKRTVTLFAALLLALGLAACSQAGPEAGSGDVLVVTDGSVEKTYTAAGLEALPAAEATFREVAYRGVPLSALLADAGFAPDSLRAVRAVAADGFSASYESDLFNLPDTLVAYSRTDGPLAADEGAFRMVLPGQEGKLNVRILVRIEAVP
jgi:DMSO/TMAO reductase YedYZ molybdopterin-dependent catalytic subunit